MMDLSCLFKEKAKFLTAIFMVLVLMTGWLTMDGYNQGVDQRPEEGILFMNLKAYAGLFMEEKEGSYMQSLGDADVLTNIERDHGAAAMYLLAPFSAVSALRNNRILWVRTYRMVVYFVFWVGMLALYWLARKMTQSRLAGITAVLILWLSPRFFAESVYNNKDGLALATMMMALACGYRFLEEQNWKTILLFGLTNALAINTRISGLFSFGLVGLLYIVELTVEKRWNRKAFGCGFFAVLSTLVFFWLLTPATWYGHFIDFWQYYLLNSGSFTRWNSYTMQMGKIFHTTLRPIPFWYLPAWIAVTTPPVFLVLMAAGFMEVAATGIHLVFKKSWPPRPIRFRLLLVILIIASYLSIVLGKSNIYNGWRHCYFLYGPFVLLAVCTFHGFIYKSASPVLRTGAILLLGIQIVFCAGNIIMTYPYEYAYFNFLAGPHPEESWDVDYWGIGAKEAMRQIYQELGPCSVSDPAQNVTSQAWEGSDADVQAGIQVTPYEKSDYLLIEVSTMNKMLKAINSEWYDGSTGIYVLSYLKDKSEPLLAIYSGRTLVYAVYENPWL